MKLKYFPEVKAPVKYLRGEKFTHLNINAKRKYLISTKGRIYSYYLDRILRGGIRSGVLTFEFTPADKKNIPVPYTFKDGNMKPIINGRVAVTIQKLVALTFLKKPKGAHVVIHTGYDKLYNGVDNIKWISKDKLIIHLRGYPTYKGYNINRAVGFKITARQVLEIKKLLKDKRAGKPSLSIKEIASKYKIAEMQIYRIQNGDLWSHVGELIKKKVTPVKLSDTKVLKIRSMLKEGVLGVKVAKRFNITPAAVSRIKNNKYYQNVHQG